MTEKNGQAVGDRIKCDKRNISFQLRYAIKNFKHNIHQYWPIILLLQYLNITNVILYKLTSMLISGATLWKYEK